MKNIGAPWGLIRIVKIIQLYYCEVEILISTSQSGSPRLQKKLVFKIMPAVKGSVLPLGNNEKIFPAIVQGVVVEMVNLFPCLAAHNKSMHADCSSFAFFNYTSMGVIIAG